MDVGHRDHRDLVHRFEGAQASPLVGAPVAVSTTKLVPNSYANVIWHFRLESIGGLALLWAVIAGVFGLLADAPARAATRSSRAAPPATEPLAGSGT